MNPVLAGRIYGAPFPLVDVTVIPDEEVMNHRSMTALTLLQKQIHRRDLADLLDRLAGSCLDLVEYNNNIVLEYHEKEVIRLKTAALVTGYAGETKSLGVTVNSKYPLALIEWQASALQAARCFRMRRGLTAS